MVTKETFFNDLPQDIKQKIISIRNMSNIRPSNAVLFPIKELGNISIPFSKWFHTTVVELIETSKSMQNINIKEKLKEEINAFKKYVLTYRQSLNEKNFVAEMDKMIQLLECRYKKIMKT